MNETKIDETRFEIRGESVVRGEGTARGVFKLGSCEGSQVVHPVERAVQEGNDGKCSCCSVVYCLLLCSTNFV